jgi:hypothetical protein
MLILQGLIIDRANLPKLPIKDLFSAMIAKLLQFGLPPGNLASGERKFEESPSITCDCMVDARHGAMGLIPSERPVVAINHTLIDQLIKFSPVWRVGWCKFVGSFFLFSGVEAVILFGGLNHRIKCNDLKGALVVEI